MTLEKFKPEQKVIELPCSEQDITPMLTESLRQKGFRVIYTKTKTNDKRRSNRSHGTRSKNNPQVL